MKKHLLFAFLLCSFAGISNEITPHRIASKIEDVTVFITGAEVHRTAKANLKAGRNKLIFTSISTVADHKSVQFNSSSPLNLVSVSCEIDYVGVTQKGGRIKVISDSIALMQDQIVALQNDKGAYVAEKQLLDQNRSIKGEQENLSVEELSAMAAYIRKHYMEINKAMTEYDRQIRDLTNLKFRYENQLTELNYKETIKSNQIIVIVDSDVDKTVELDLKFMVSNCGWQANYDLLATSVADKITLKYKAKVYNNTGNDWSDVNLFLSTADPNLSASAPELSPWYLNYEALRNQTNDDYRGDTYVVPDNRGYDKWYQNYNLEPQQSQNLIGLTFDYGVQSSVSNAESQISFQTIQVSQLSTTFEIQKKYSIPCDAKPYLVDITEHNLSAFFTHKAVPKLANDAYLLANIVGWENLDLVPGPTQVYFSEVFVGQSYMNTSNVSDTLRLSFGRDSKIPVTRKLLQEFSDKKVVGSNRRDSYTYSIVAKNNRDTPVRIDLYDQIPISQDSDIAVSIEDISGATYNEVTGQLSWLVSLDPGESKTFKLSFTIKYPKDKVIQVKKYRSMAAPSF